MVLQEVPNDWHQWIADCIMMEIPKETMMTYLCSSGFQQETAQHAIEKAEGHPYILAGSKIARKIKRLDWLLELYRTLMSQSKEFESIERRPTISREEFYKHYHCMNRPLILTDIISDWHTLNTWSPQYFKDQYGHQDIQVEHTDDKGIRGYKVMNFARYVDIITTLESSNDWYMTINNIPFNMTTIPELYNEIDRLPLLLDPEGENPNGLMLFGPMGTRTSLHYDVANALYCQIYGRKHFRLVSPNELPHLYPYDNFMSAVDMDDLDENRFPLFKQAKIYEVILEPGEVLFLPIGWWHDVVALDVSISLSFSRNFYGKEGYRTYWELYGEHPLFRE